MRINLTSNTPFFCPPRRMAYNEIKEVQKIVEQMVKDGIIRPRNSPYASAIVLVKRKDGRYRLCNDFRKLNKMTERDNYPIPLIPDCLEYLLGKCKFKLLDLTNGFYHVKIEEESIKYTAFVTIKGQFEYVRMQFGLKSAPAVFQRFINNIFADLIVEDKIKIYLDDVLIANKDDEPHFEILTEVLKRLRSRGLMLNLK